MRSVHVLCVLFLHIVVGVFMHVAIHAGTLDKLVPRPKTGYVKPGLSVMINPTTTIYTSADPRVERAYGFLQSYCKQTLNDTLVHTTTTPASNAISLVLYTGPTTLDRPILVPQGYTLDVDTAARITITAMDADGLFNGVATLRQLCYSLTVPPLPTLTVPGVWIWDAPDYPTRWVFSMLNLLSRGPQLRTVLDTMSTLKLNGLQHAEWNYSIINVAQPRVFDTIPVFRKYADERNIEIIPSVLGQGWSSNILYQNPNLATGFPAKAHYTMVADTGQIIADPRVALPNNGFETLAGNGQFSGWGFYDGPGISILPDQTVKRSGMQSARLENFESGNPSGNARFSRTMPCDPETQYSMDCYIKTEGFKGGFFQLLAIGRDAAGDTRVLTYTNFNIPQTSNGWIHAEARFNTLEYTNVILYAGVWGGKLGKVWIDDFNVWPSGMCNVLRREGAPVWVKNATSGRIYTEGVDYQPIVDNVMMSRRGEYGRYHRPPVPRRIATGAINNGDVLEVSFHHPLTTVADTAVSGSTMNTMSNDSVYLMLDEQMRLVHQHLDAKAYFLGHDEIRAFNRDSGDLKRKLSPRQMLGQNIIWCDSVVRSYAPQAKVYIWNDMIDSTHNAVNNYYLVNGDLRGIWDDIPKDIIVANWYGSNAVNSLGFMARKGFKQITCPYYDVGNASNIRSRRIIQDTIPNIVGSMYTTWAEDYSQLRAFSSYMWHAGAFIEHKPLTRTDIMVMKPPTVFATITPDPFDNTDRVVKATLHTVRGGDVVTGRDMTEGTDNQWSSPIQVMDTIGYRICATNSQGLTQCTPWYHVIMSDSTPDTTTTINDGPDVGSTRQPLLLAPNPVAGQCMLTSPVAMHYILVYNTQGVQVMKFAAHGAFSLPLDVSALPTGTYSVVVNGSTVRMVIQ